MNLQLHHKLALTTVFLLFSAVSTASPTVSGNTISWPDDGWYQVQDESDYSQVCGGGTQCEVEAGSYLVINHSSGERFSGVRVGEQSQVVTVSDSTLAWPNDGWYQVQTADTYVSVCEGGQSCDVADGVYNVINLTTGTRYNGISVLTSTVASEGYAVIGNVISLTDEGWIEIQRQSDNASFCQGPNACTVPAGIYTAINHTNGARYSNIEVLESGDEPVVIIDEATIHFSIDGSPHAWEEEGFYQVQRSDSFLTVCEGGSSCSVPPGSYIVVNLTTGARYEDIVVNADSSDNLFFDPADVTALNAFFQNLSKLLDGEIFDDFLSSSAALPQSGDNVLQPNTAFYNGYLPQRLPEATFNAFDCDIDGRIDQAEVDVFRYTLRVMDASDCASGLATFNGGFATMGRHQYVVPRTSVYNRFSFTFSPEFSIEDVNGVRRMDGRRYVLGNTYAWDVESFHSDYQDQMSIEDFRVELGHTTILLPGFEYEVSKTLSTQFEFSAAWTNGQTLVGQTTQFFDYYQPGGTFDTGRLIITADDDSRITLYPDTGDSTTFFVEFWPYAEPSRLELRWREHLSFPCRYASLGPNGPSSEEFDADECRNIHYLPEFLDYWQ
jgi:hypothetical protein